MIEKIVEITLPIFVVALIGFFYARAVKPDLAGANKLVVDIALPILIFTSLSTKEFNPQTAALFSAAAVLLIVLSGLLAYPLSRLSGASWRALLPCVMFTNVGPVGIPLIVLAYGPAGLAPAVVLLVLSNILHFTLGAGLMSGRVDWRMVYANPLVWATLLGIGFSQLQWSLPSWAGAPLNMIGSILVPMMLLSLGARLSSSQVSDVKVGILSALIVLGTRLVATWLILQFLPLHGIERGALILFACMPAAVFNFMLADRFHCEPNKVASMVIVGHVASLVCLPLGIWLAFM
ncbi:MAG: AEC family transporter [Gammaproteobacteria bacterium]|nr:AEC family transporter [Rhodocyclaceae bacterium]MBU3909693.1 AEC family transporter [Gammaproteobacteria bacterium]MBU4005226.1 AEC family transporter [Gammaproteobacteria bacterium]MBU4022405.1 AEC family transporter [Gammaproteobacteria bacterium]MBU4097712.1 AEC family transporter [Gammaproteobacteria bacterium]